MSQEPNELFDHEWTTLQLLWERVKADKPPSLTSEEIEIINTLLTADGRVGGRRAAWALLNRAEQKVGAHLRWPLIAAEYAILLDIARDRKLPSLATYEDKAAFMAATPATAGDGTHQTAIYLALLGLLQSGFIETRFRRQLRKETADRLLLFGGVTVLITLAMPMIFVVASYLAKMKDHRWDTGLGGYLFSIEPGFGLVMAATFGLLGAYFSRATDFQSKLDTFSFDDVIKVYQPKVLVLRLLYGMVGAMIFYYLLSSGLIGGDAFPKLEGINIPKHVGTVVEAIKPGAEPAKPLLAPTADLAKLLVWSFLAGFSERLVPDALERTQSQMSKQ